MNQRSHQLDSVNQAWSGTMEEAAVESEHAPFANGREVPPGWKVAKDGPLGRSPALRKTARQEKNDFWRFPLQLIDGDTGGRLSPASQPRISTSQSHHLRDPL